MPHLCSCMHRPVTGFQSVSARCRQHSWTHRSCCCWDHSRWTLSFSVRHLAEWKCLFGKRAWNDFLKSMSFVGSDSTRAPDRNGPPIPRLQNGRNVKRPVQEPFVPSVLRTGKFWNKRSLNALFLNKTKQFSLPFQHLEWHQTFQTTSSCNWSLSSSSQSLASHHSRRIFFNSQLWHIFILLQLCSHSRPSPLDPL